MGDTAADSTVWRRHVRKRKVAGRGARDTPAETMTAILKEEPAALASGVDTTAAGLPPGLARLVSRCLEKRREERFQSARDLGFALEAAASTSRTSSAAVPAARAQAPWRRALPHVWLAAGGLIGALAAQRFLVPAPGEPPRTRPLTFSGQDRDPAASPDGCMLAFSSTRDGASRIWIKQLQGGGEAPLTSGPDRFPRFSPDGSSLLFGRVEGESRSLHRIGLVGGEPRRLADDVAQADWLPDGTRIAFLRQRHSQASEGAAPTRQRQVGLREIASGREQVLYSPEANATLFLRASPDGRTLAVVEGPSILNTRYELTLVDVASGAVRKAIPPGHPLGCLAWSGAGGIALARAGSPLGDGGGAPARVFLLDPERAREHSLLFTTGLFPLAASLEARNGSCDVLGPGQLVLDQIEWRMNLSEVPLAGGGASPRALTSGNSRDRQPAYSPDGSRIVFTSNRSGNMDLWILDTRTGALRQLTDDPAQDWDPGFTPDGRHVLWSSDRSGNLEIWIAGDDGSGARQLTRDGVDAENPTATPDGRFVVYTTGHPQRYGLWRIRPDGSDDHRLVTGAALIPEVSPDGRRVLFITDNRDGGRFIRVADVESGTLVPFALEVRWPASASDQVLYGRARWAPDGKGILFIGANRDGRPGVFFQEFAPGRDTSATRREVAGFDPALRTESLGVSPDGKRLVVSTLQEYSSLTLAEGLTGLDRPRR